ncbi:MAG: hypothetical protein NE327_22365 [Lentisphaeraceae bacterium]|nr:hypothetical protein [Lentisphaeraceae bacterium]
MGHGNTYDKESVKAPGSKWTGLAFALFVIGAGITAGGWYMGGAEAKAHNMHSYLTSFMFYLSIALGGLFFVMLQHLVRAGWSVTVRRIAEGFMKNLLWMLLLFIPIFLNVGNIFAWADDGGHGHAAPAAVEKKDNVEHAGGSEEHHYGRIDKVDDYKLAHHLEHVLHHKQKYLAPGFFKVRALIYFAIWIILAMIMFKRSTAQDEHGDALSTVTSGKIAAGAMPFFALTVTFAAFDWMMSLDYAWFSTIFGVIYFASGFIGIMASMIIAIFLLQKRGYMKGAVNKEHFHDMGKFMFAFIIFWAYTSFSQFILIRYPSIPEETVWYMHRWVTPEGEGWSKWSLAVVFLHFILPFILLLSRHVKRNTVTCTLMAVWMLVASYIHFYWIIMPTLEFPEKTLPHFGLNDILIVVGMGLFFVGGFLFNLKNVNLIPVKDPRLDEALNFTNY